MQSMLFVMAILGCGEGDAPCREVDVVQTQYQSEAACLAASEDQLLRRDDILFPQVVAQCRRADARPQLLRGEDVLSPDGGALPEAPLRHAAAARPAQPGT